MVGSRREFLGASLAPGAACAARAGDAERPAGDGMRMLVDTTKCIGCRRCEAACQRSHALPVSPEQELDEPAVFRAKRRPDARSLTVVNRFEAEGDGNVFVKSGCMHCLQPACVSACLVSAMTRRPDGAVVYDAGRCMGCRYCMVACPFEMPAYEYADPLTPLVRKCDLCAGRVPEEAGGPACAEVCPEEALAYGPRPALVEEARARIRRHPETYVDHVYGEEEVGGTSVLYLSPVPMRELGLWDLPSHAPPLLTETVQHSIFKKFGPPLMLYGLLGAAMWLGRPRVKLVRT